MDCKIIGYQITNKNNEIPLGLFSFQIFKTPNKAHNFLKGIATNDTMIAYEWYLLPILDGDIFEPTFI
jgi:hypothetical protein